jgi:hypothetical protein
MKFLNKTILFPKVIDENFDSLNGQVVIGNNASLVNIEKLFESTPAYRDYVRQGLISFKSQPQQQQDTVAYSDECLECDENATPPFRLCTLNINYQLCKSYPALFVVPRDTNDECIKKNAKCHRQNRFASTFLRTFSAEFYFKKIIYNVLLGFLLSCGDTRLTSQFYCEVADFTVKDLLECL